MGISLCRRTDDKAEEEGPDANLIPYRSLLGIVPARSATGSVGPEDGLEGQEVLVIADGKGNARERRLRLRERLGGDKVSEVRLAEVVPTNRVSVVKIFNKRLGYKRKQIRGNSIITTLDLAVTEASIMKKTGSYAVKLFAIFETPQHLFLEIEYAPMGPLSTSNEDNMYTILEPTIARTAFCCLSEGVQALHAAGIVHGDIKPENLMRMDSKGRIKLADFGSAIPIPNDEKKVNTWILGTPAFMAPELLQHKARFHGLGRDLKRTDDWSSAVTLHVITTGRLPFQGNSMEQVFASMSNSEPDRKLEYASSSLQGLLSQMLRLRIEKRKFLVDVAGHAWVAVGTDRQ